MKTYSTELQDLLRLGDPGSREVENWQDYGVFGIGPQHLLELVEMVGDEALDASDGIDCWAPLHAARALGQMKAMSAAGPLLETLNRMLIRESLADFVLEDIGSAFVKMGPPVIPQLRTFLFDRTRHEQARTICAESLTRIGVEHPDFATECIAILTQHLEQGAGDDQFVNGFVVSELINFKAVSACSAIRTVYESGDVDESICGSIEEVEFYLGLRAERPKGVFPDEMEMPQSIKSGRQRQKTLAKKKKARRKHAKLARRRNKR